MILTFSVTAFIAIILGILLSVMFIGQVLMIAAIEMYVKLFENEGGANGRIRKSNRIPKD